MGIIEGVITEALDLTEESRKPKTVVLYKDGDLVWLSVDDLQSTRWNPHQRTVIEESEFSSMGTLLSGIMKFRKILIPVVIDVCGNLIEGNRRLAAVTWLIAHRQLEPTFKIPCFVRQSEEHSSEEMFAWINHARKQITNSVALEIYLKSEQALVDKISSKSAYFVKIMGGTEKATEFSHAGGSLIYLKSIETLATFTGLEPYTIGMWLVKYKLRHKTKRMVEKLSRELLIKLITQNKYPRF
jgi:hypothetical protein